MSTGLALIVVSRHRLSKKVNFEADRNNQLICKLQGCRIGKKYPESEKEGQPIEWNSEQKNSPEGNHGESEPGPKRAGPIEYGTELPDIGKNTVAEIGMNGG